MQQEKIIIRASEDESFLTSEKGEELFRLLIDSTYDEPADLQSQARRDLKHVFHLAEKELQEDKTVDALIGKVRSQIGNRQDLRELLDGSYLDIQSLPQKEVESFLRAVHHKLGPITNKEHRIANRMRDLEKIKKDDRIFVARMDGKTVGMTFYRLAEEQAKGDTARRHSIEGLPVYEVSGVVVLPEYWGVRSELGGKKISELLRAAAAKDIQKHHPAAMLLNTKNPALQKALQREGYSELSLAHRQELLQEQPQAEVDDAWMKNGWATYLSTTKPPITADIGTNS
ncbi:MAG: hypothetical protein Q7R81_05260 [Candidatus Peregrinibacteria bacterium]|nr:hypothetical protein [Candidatus Peregrinibacteria bacterium]